MEQLPLEIEIIINEYKTEFEDCEILINNALEIFFLIQNRVDGVVDDLKLCQCNHSTQLRKVLSSIIQEAERVITVVLRDEAVYFDQMKTLLDLQQEVFIEVTDSVLHPFFVHLTNMPQEPTQYYATEEDVPQLYLEG